MTLVDMGFCNLATPVYKRYQALILFLCHIHQSPVIEPLGMMHLLLSKQETEIIFLFYSIRFDSHYLHSNKLTKMSTGNIVIGLYRTPSARIKMFRLHQIVGNTFILSKIQNHTMEILHGRAIPFPDIVRINI